MKIDEIAQRLGTDKDEAGRFLKTQGLTAAQVNDSNIGHVVSEFGSRALAQVESGQITKSAEPTAQPQAPATPQINVAEIVTGAKRQAVESVVQTAGKLGDATSDFMAMLNQEIDAERQAQYRPAAQQLAKQIVASEGAMVGKSVGQLCTFISELNLFEGTEIGALQPAPITTLVLTAGE